MKCHPVLIFTVIISLHLFSAVCDASLDSTLIKSTPTTAENESSSSSSSEQKSESTTVVSDSRDESVSETRKSYNGTQIVRVHLRNKEQRNSIRELADKGEIETWLNNGTVADVVVPDNETLHLLRGKNFKFDVIINDLQNAMDIENPALSDIDMEELVGRKVGNFSHGGGRSYIRWSNPMGVVHLVRRTQTNNRTHKRRKKRKGHKLTWQMYHKMDDIHGYLDYLANTYPQRCSVEIIGNSVQGRPLKVLKVSSGQPNRPAVWVDSGIHAREWITPASLTWVISQLIEGNNRGESDADFNSVDWYLLPLVNPDGYEHSRKVDRLWRKNRANTERGSCAGTDLNRNFGYKWGGQGASRQPCRETFAGAREFSEPETSAINRFITRQGQQIKGYVSLHSYGQYILYPWGYDRKVPHDYADLERVGRAMAKAIVSTGGPAYTVGAAANTLYPASGGSDDWAKGSARIKYAYTIELRDNGQYGFILPASYILPTAKDAYAALRVLAKEVRQLIVTLSTDNSAGNNSGNNILKTCGP